MDFFVFLSMVTYKWLAGGEVLISLVLVIWLKKVKKVIIIRFKY